MKKIQAGMILGCPVVDNHEFTKSLLDSLAKTVTNAIDFCFVIIDNNSEKKYLKKDYNKYPFPVEIIHNKENKGYYYPLKQLEELFPDASYIGLCHNDMTFYETGWNQRVRETFAADSLLGCVGFCGSFAVDRLGGRSYGTVCNFRGENGQPQATTGSRITGTKPSVSLDSLFMMFRREAIASLGIDENIALCHFYDRIWSLKLWTRDWRVIVLGIEIDHQGGRTSCSPRYNEDAKIWCRKRGVEILDDNGDLSVYKEAERRYLGEFAAYIPCIVDDNYNVRSHS